MIYDYHVVLGALSVIFGIVGYALYFHGMFRGSVRPHPFTWFIFGCIDIIVFIAQVVRGGGAGTWALGFSILVVFIIAAVSLRRSDIRITVSDWVCLVGALAAIVVWRATSDPFGAVVIATAINAVAVVPTVRKAYADPYNEGISMWACDIGKYASSIPALSSLTPVTAMFPAGIVVINSALIATLLLRRRQLAKR